MIKVRALTKKFNGKPVLRGIDLDIMKQETLVILGPSGQGKTVLIKTLVRLIEPDSGSVYYNGKDIFLLNKKGYKELQKTIAFVFQENALFDFLNVKDNLSLYLKMHTKLPADKILQEVDNAISFVGLEQSVLTKFPEELSGGMSKRVAIARAMITQPRIIFYDEPTVGLDEGNVLKVIDLIYLLKKRICATSVIVTHDIDLMRKVADCVVLLKEGSITYIGKKEDVSDSMLDDLYDTGENHEQ